MPKGIRILAITFLWSFYGWSQNELPTAYARSVAERLCSPEFHGRGYVKKGDSIASAFLADEFKKIGLKPLNNSYYQEFTHDVNTFPGEMTVISEGDTLMPGVDYIVDPSCPSVKLVLRFKRISPAEATQKALLQKAVTEVVNSGKINAFLLDLRTVSADTLKLLNGVPEMLASFAHTIVWSNQKLTWSAAPEQLPYPLLHIAAKVPLNKEITVDIEALRIKSYASRNVIGYLPAYRKTKRTIILSAHYDHLGRMGKDTYFPGANDNASGTATLLCVAKELAKAKRKVNYVFIAFAGEEAGLIGSHFFTENPLVPLKRIRFLLNLDIMGSGEEGITVVNATKHPNEFQLFQKINTEANYLTQIKSRGPAANSDHYWFSEKGVPAFFIYTMGPNKNYHDIHDTYQNLTFAETSDLIQLIAVFLADL